MNPLLSICIPTYNRADWLRSALWNWLPQVEEFRDEVELIVSDNCSTDETPAVAREAAEQWGRFTYHRNSENLGPTGNLLSLAKNLATGKYLWLIGDDDLPRAGTVEKVLDVLRRAGDVNYIYVNYDYWHPQPGIKEIIDANNQKHTEGYSKDRETKLIARAADIITDDWTCFTPILCSIWTRKHAVGAFEVGITQPLYSSMESTIPHAVYIAENLLNQPAYYIGTPLILAAYANASWSSYASIFFAEYMPELYDLLEKNGVDKQIVVKHRKTILKFSYDFLFDLYANKNAEYRDNFSLLRFTRRNYRYSEFWEILAKVLQGVGRRVRRL